MSTPRENSQNILKEDYETVVSSPDNEKEFVTQCIELLETVNIRLCFKLLPFGDIKDGYLREAKKEKKLVKFDQLEGALKNLEKYVQNLLKKPWCKDFHTIKIFNGFFKYEIEQWIPLDTVCKVLNLMGYQETSEGIFEIVQPDKDRVLMVGLELYLAHTQLSVFRRSSFLEKYSMEDILEAWACTTGKVPNIINWLHQNVSLKETLAKVSFEPSFDRSHDTAKSDVVTTATQHQHYDMNGQSTHQNIHAINYGIDPHYKSSEMNESSATKMLSLPSSTKYSDDQMYGDDDGDDPAIQDITSHGSSSYMYVQRSYPSMPPCYSGVQQRYSETKCRDDLQVHKYHQSKDISAEQLYGNSYDHTVPSQNKFIQSSIENHMIDDMNPNTLGLSGPQNMVDESIDKIDKGKERCEEIFQGRLVEAGIKNLDQQQLSPKHGTDQTKDKAERQCYLCLNIAIIICEKCEKSVCKDCLKIFQESPCKSNEKHLYDFIKNKAHLYENISSSQEHLSDSKKKEEKIPCADFNKWQCKHCTVLNSPETSVCVTCCHSKDVIVPNLKPGDWVCSECTLANPEGQHDCKVCEAKKQRFCTTFV